MKELSTEEKAKCYDEAIERARIWKDKSGMPKDKQNILDDIFPELKESEDERIMKWIIGVLSTYEHDRDLRNAAIAWLEKQAEHANFRNKIQIGDKVTRNRDGVLVNLSQLNRVAKVDKRQGEQKPNYNNKELKDVVIAELSKYNRYDLNAPWALDSTGLQYPLYFANLGAKWQKEQKPAWSEEDEEQLGRAIYMMEQLDMTKSWDDVYNWLKSLKDKVLSQPRQEWSEDDESLRRRCIGAIDMANLSDYTKDNLLNWLKSLKDRIPPQTRQEWSEEDATHYNRILKELNLQKEMPINASVIEEVKSDIIWLKSLRPQNRWKPSVFHLECISDAIAIYEERSINAIGLKEILEELKKLREE